MHPVCVADIHAISALNVQYSNDPREHRKSLFRCHFRVVFLMYTL